MTDNELPPRPTRIDREIASTRDGVDITRGYTGPLLYTSDRILRARGNDLQVYEQVLSEPQVKTVFEQRRSAVVSRPWIVEPASERGADKRAADFVRAALQRIGFDRVTDRMLYGIFYGYAVAELLYQSDGNQITLAACKVRNRRRFRYTPEGELRMLTMSNMLQGEELPPWSFWHFSTGADHDDEPYGIGLGHWLYWPVQFKRAGAKFWARFLEKFAAPTVVGEYDVGATDAERARLLSAVQAVQTDTGVILPQGMAIKLLEAQRSGSIDYTRFAEYWDDMVSKVVVGQTMTSSDGSSRSQAEVHMDVRGDIVRADSDLVCESLNSGPVTWLTRWNFADADPPRVYRDLDEPEDLDSRAGRDQKIFLMGYKPTLRHVVDTYGGEWVERTAPAAAGAAPATGPDGQPLAAPPVEFAAASGDAAPPAQMLAQVDRTVSPAVDGWLDEVRQLVDTAQSWDEVRAGLDELIPRLSLDEYADALATATSAARLAGRYEVREEGAATSAED